ncbi:MAG: hypothetical protein AAGA77_22945 [Bacteroidota bacterium]
MPDTQLREEIINGFRMVIDQRYRYENLRNRYQLPESIHEHTVDKIRNYFLHYIYPEPYKRQEIDQAFETLNAYVKQPQKLIQILLASLALSFKYGRHLPKLLKTGLNAFKSFKATNQFEKLLAENAIKDGMESPFDRLKIERLIKKLSRKQIDDYMEGSQKLFETLHDQELIKKILEILQFIVEHMRKNIKRYSNEEIQGVEMGLVILTEGNSIFNSLSSKDQKEIIPFIVQVEKEEMYKIFDT